MWILMLKIWRYEDRLIFNMGIPILVRRHLYIETAPKVCIIWRWRHMNVAASQTSGNWSVHRLVEAKNQDNITAPHYWPFVRENPTMTVERASNSKLFPCHGVIMTHGTRCNVVIHPENEISQYSNWPYVLNCPCIYFRISKNWSTLR